MLVHTDYLWFNTRARRELINITDRIAETVTAAKIAEGFCLVSAMHITAGIWVNDEESGLKQDLVEWLDRLHIVVAPVILGSGIPGLVLPAIARMNEALRVPMHIRALGDEVLFDCDLSTRRSRQTFQHPGKLRA